MQAAAALIRRKNHGVSSCRAIRFRTTCNYTALLPEKTNRTLPHQAAAIPNKKENR